MALRVGMNVSGYATLLKDASRSPAEVTVLDDEAGVFRVDYRNDPSGSVAKFDPSQHVDNSGEDARASYDPREAGDDGSGALLAHSPLKKDHRIAVVMTAIPAFPNDESQFHRIPIRPIDVEAALGIELGPCLGPVMEVRLDPQEETARFAWLDDESGLTDAAFGLNGSGGALVFPIDEDRLTHYAIGVAASRYAALVDRLEGGYTGAFQPSARPTGAIVAVSHSLEEGGVAKTDRELRAPPAPVDGSIFMPRHILRAVKKLVQR